MKTPLATRLSASRVKWFYPGIFPSWDRDFPLAFSCENAVGISERRVALELQLITIARRHSLRYCDATHTLTHCWKRTR